MPSITKGKIRSVFAGADPDLIERFIDYHIQNPNVWKQFKARANEIRATGRARYSQWTIIQAIRWDHDVQTTGDVFKINNDFIALYARLLIFLDPTFTGFFELRKMKPRKRKISREEQDRIAAI